MTDDSSNRKSLPSFEILRLPAEGMEIVLVRNFLGPEDCAHFISLIELDNFPSQVYPPTADSTYRNSFSSNLDPRDSATKRLSAEICAILEIDEQYGEAIQGQRYHPGQQFQAHIDAFPNNDPNWREEIELSGQRTWTAMIWLNEPRAGGKTIFPKAGVRLTPKAGSLIAWYNLGEDGTPNANTLHAGEPVEDGVKYVLTKWFRERPWKSTNQNQLNTAD